MLFALMAATVPSTYSDEGVTTTGSGATGSFESGSDAELGSSGTGGAGAPGAASGPGGGAAGPGGGEAVASEGGAPGGGVGGGPVAGQQPCADRPVQIPGDPYSPPCFEFSGDNGGATAKGVTPEEVIVSARILNEKGFQQTLATLAGADIVDEPEDVKRTISALAEYFNSRMQFYGRKLAIKFYDGKGSGVNELQGAGQAEAEADAITV
ncbi:MAG TPA: hypothetical protein VFK43_18745, partial [Acidimicrobiales bacterium]|nr:hypothetical protein [Acidimicrobiales bacterium]